MSFLLFKWPVTRYIYDAIITSYAKPPKKMSARSIFPFSSFRFLSRPSFAPDCQPCCVCQSWWWGVTLSDRLPSPFKRQVTFLELEKSDRTGVGRRALWPMRANASSFGSGRPEPRKVMELGGEG